MICQACYKKVATEKHHKFSQGTKTGWRRKLYGSLLDDTRNIIHLCYGCHHDKPLKKWDEIQFCIALEIQPKSKEAKLIWRRLSEEHKFQIKAGLYK